MSYNNCKIYKAKGIVMAMAVLKFLLASGVVDMIFSGEVDMFSNNSWIVFLTDYCMYVCLYQYCVLFVCVCVNVAGRQCGALLGRCPHRGLPDGVFL